MEIKKNRAAKIGVIGGGLIGKERLVALNTLKQRGRNLDICGVYDPFIKDHSGFEVKYQVKLIDDLKEFWNLNLDWVFIAVPHDDAIGLVKESLKRNLNVLVEKPLGRNISEANEIFDFVQREGQLWVGFNYRFYDGILKALIDLKNRKFGNLISVNMILGHGCNPDILKSWKLDPVKAGGGCLIDPGIHFLDLCRIISDNKIKVKSGVSWSGFWNTGIEEECHFLFDCEKYFINMQISIVKWRSTFRIEINGDEGYGIITGRNRSYGTQKYIFGKRWGWQSGKSQLESEELISESSGENVFTDETEALLFGEGNGFIKPCSVNESFENMKLLEECRKFLN